MRGPTIGAKCGPGPAALEATDFFPALRLGIEFTLAETNDSLPSAVVGSGVGFRFSSVLAEAVFDVFDPRRLLLPLR